MEGAYRLKIVSGDKEFEVEGDKSFVLDMLKKFQNRVFIGGTEVPETKGEKNLPAQVVVTSATGKTLSVGEFIRQLGVKKHTDIVLGFGYYLEKYSGVREFGPADINKCYYDAKMETSNTSQMLIQNIKRGYIMSAKGAKKKGQYTLTSTGEEFIVKSLAKKKSA
jgi:predicted transcriptional regulator